MPDAFGVQVPTCNTAVCARSHAMTLNAVILPVAGFSGVGRFWIDILKSELSEVTRTECRLRSKDGSAQTSIRVLAGPSPARLMAAATFTFAGNARATSVTLPSRTSSGSDRA